MPKSKRTKSILLAGRRFSPAQLIALSLPIVAVGTYFVIRSLAASLIPGCGSAPVSLVPYVGNACKLSNGLWKVDLPNGSISTTHGFDKLSDVLKLQKTANTNGGSAYNPSPVAPTCVNSSDYHNQLIIATPAGRTNRYSQIVSDVLKSRDYADGILNAEGKAFGYNMTFKFTCGSPDNVQMSTSNTDYYSVINDLINKGYTNAQTKYWVFVDTPCVGGVSGIAGDDRLLPTNYNNGNSYSLDLGCGLTANQDGYGPPGGGFIFAHEVGHGMGAVQQSAPHSTTGYHCIDGLSVMCQGPDGSSNSNRYQTICPNTSYDCNNDDYFNPRPDSNNYLSTHWNIASGYNHFISGLPAPPPDREAPSAPSGLSYSCRQTNQICLYWSDSTDNIGVAGYRLYRNGQMVYQGNSTGFNDTGLASNTTYSYYVTAFDAAGNVSQPSNAVSARTALICFFLCY